MPRDVEFDVTANDKTGGGLTAAEKRFEESQKRIKKINEDNQKKIQADVDKSAAKIGRTLESVFGKSSPKLAMALGDAFTGAAANAVPILAGVAVAAAPLLAATVSAAVIGGVGAGGVIGGIYLATSDPRVAAAGQRLGTKLLSSLQQDATPFVEPTLEGIGKIELRFEQLRPKIQRIFANSAQFVAPLTDGVLRAVDGIVDGIDKLTARAQPVMDQLGDSVGQIGEHIGQALDTISKGSEGAASGLKLVTDATTALVDVSATSILALTKTWGWLDKIGVATGIGGPLLSAWGGSADKAKDAAYGLSEGLQLTKEQWDNNEEGIARTNQYLEDSQKQMMQAAQAARDLTTANQSLYGSETSLGEATDRATKARKENGRTLDANTEKGRSNREALLGVAKAAQGEYEAFVRVNGEGPRSSALAARLRGDFIKLATAFTGSKQKAEELANKILGIPKTHKTDVKVESNAIQASKAAKAAINSINSRTVSVTVTVNTSRLTAVENRLSRLHGSGLYGSSAAHWEAVDTGGGQVRTGGPTPVNATVESHLYLDGSLIYTNTARQIAAFGRRQAWRTRVGHR
jgi:hypothetical protein